jgi:ABC-type amino acid transport substrate-binding protein
MSKQRPNRWRSALINVGVVIVLLTAVSFLPPDTSLKERQQSGVIKLCVPQSYPPLVTGDEQNPGFDVEMAEQIAQDLGLRLVVNVMPSIGRDFNPRNWLLTRAQCDMIGGGVADTPQTRGFLQTVTTGIETGWVAALPDGQMPGRGATVAVLPGSSGLDRLALSSWLRERGIRPMPVRDVAALTQALATGQAQAGILERFTAGTLHDTQPDLPLFWMPADHLPRYQMAFGLWKGDETFRRVVVAAIDELRDSKTLMALQARYNLDTVLPEMEWIIKP